MRVCLRCSYLCFVRSTLMIRDDNFLFVTLMFFVRSTLTFAMTSDHILAGEEQIALHWDKKTVCRQSKGS